MVLNQYLGNTPDKIIDLGRTEARVSGEIKDPNQYALLYDIRQFKGNGLISFVPRVEVQGSLNHKPAPQMQTTQIFKDITHTH